MKFWMQIMVFITLGLTTMSSQSVVGSDVDGILHVPISKKYGSLNSRDLELERNSMLDSEKLSQAIAFSLRDIDQVYNISFGPLQDNFRDEFYFDVHFTVVTTEGVVQKGIKCSSVAHLMSIYKLFLTNCENDEVVLGEIIGIPLSAIRYEEQKRRTWN